LAIDVDGPEIRGTLKRGEVAHPVRMKQQPESSEAEIAGDIITAQAAVAVIEHRRVVENLLRESSIDGKQAHRLANTEAEMKEAHLEAQTITGP